MISLIVYASRIPPGLSFAGLWVPWVEIIVERFRVFFTFVYRFGILLGVRWEPFGGELGARWRFWRRTRPIDAQRALPEPLKSY